jgi:hypothetical protein
MNRELPTAVLAVCGCLSVLAPMTRADVGADMTAAAQAFISAMSGEVAAKLTFQFGDDERLDWHFIPRDRKGVAFREMNTAQRRLAHALLRAGLSKTGHEKARNVMAVDVLFRELEGPTSRWGRDPFRYCITFFGRPSMIGQWGWRIEGHHLSLNFTLKNGKVVSITPAFWGVNPAHVREGGLKGLRALSQEEDKARTLLAALDTEQRKLCLTSEKAAREVRSVNKPHPQPDAPTGLPGARMTGKQRDLLLQVVDVYLLNYRSDLAQAARERVAQAGLDQVYFEWRGATSGERPHSYRLQGPTFKIEYINKLDPLPHVHSYFRSTKNDFGLLAGW